MSEERRRREKLKAGKWEVREGREERRRLWSTQTVIANEREELSG